MSQCASLPYVRNECGMVNVDLLKRATFGPTCRIWGCTAGKLLVIDDVLKGESKSYILAIFLTTTAASLSKPTDAKATYTTIVRCKVELSSC